MLRKLLVENYALIDSLELEFGDSLNIVTGETGAGKSILLGALGLLLGNRADAAAVKDAGRNCVVEGLFEVGDYGLEAFFEANDLEYELQTVVRRVISAAGKSRAYINDLPVQQTVLKELGARLIDVHSQHQSLMLADDGFRTAMLDSVSVNRETVQKYASVYAEMRAAQRELERLCDDAERGRQEQEWLEYQVVRLREARLVEGEQELLEGEQGELAHAEEIKAALGGAVADFTADEMGILTRLKAVRQALRGVAEHYPRGEELGERIESAYIELRDVERELAQEEARIESDPTRLTAVDERLALLHSLQQKHKAADMVALIILRDEFERRLAAITDSDEAIALMERQIDELHARATELAAKLTESREQGAAKVAEHVETVLAKLGIPAARFIVEITPAPELRASGADVIRFLFSANRNVVPAPVERMASGGEVSRLMLALKSLVAKSTRLPTIIFDEIDAGVSGRIADAMGDIIAQLAGTMQVINITHLPQIASKGDVHFVVYKDVSGASSQTRIARLDRASRIDEIAKMLSGSTITDAARAQAKLLLGETANTP
ncbi:MAG: DNA repair protein RecN [Rikenellaceae bacterium]|nr:DNA repair protein RecN [Rikenellaceae bacterium]MCL2692916.1 DNA repair protein RecN [Rikenellaceae bacterium]